MFRKSPTLRGAATGFLLSSSVISVLYLIVAPAFGLYVAGAAQAATGITALVLGLSAVGSFGATILGPWLGARTERSLRSSRRRSAPILIGRSPRRLTRLWMAAAGLFMLGAWSFLCGASVWGILPIYILILPLGLAVTGAQVRAQTLLQKEAPNALRSQIISITRGITQVVTLLGFVVLGSVFQHFSAAVSGVAGAYGGGARRRGDRRQRRLGGVLLSRRDDPSRSR